MNAPPLHTIWITNHARSDALRADFCASHFGARCHIDVRTIGPTQTDLPAAFEPYETGPAVLVIDWQGSLSPEQIGALVANAPGVPLLLLMDDDLSSASAESLLAAGAVDIAARSELTPYWLDHMVHSAHRRACTRRHPRGNKWNNTWLVP